MALQGVAILTNPLEGQKKKTEAPKGEGILPPDAVQHPCLSFLTSWARQCISSGKQAHGAQESCPGISESYLKNDGCHRPGQRPCGYRSVLAGK